MEIHKTSEANSKDFVQLSDAFTTKLFMGNKYFMIITVQQYTLQKLLLALLISRF